MAVLSADVREVTGGHYHAFRHYDAMERLRASVPVINREAILSAIDMLDATCAASTPVPSGEAQGET